MIRGILRGLSTKAITGLFARPLKSGERAFPTQIKHRNLAFSSLVIQSASTQTSFQRISKCAQALLLGSKPLQTEQIRTVTKYSWSKAKRKTVKTVPCRFFRLHWGIWIRTIAGRHKRRWKKSNSAKNRALQHVFCNATQSRMLDKMVTKFWRRPKHYIEDPYEPYHSRENFYITRRKPWRPEGCDYE